MFIDVHCHFDTLKNQSKLIEKAKKNNVGIILTAGIDHKSNVKSLELAKEFKQIKTVLGIYPTEGLKVGKEEVIKEMNFIRTNKDKISAIGEIGIDLKGQDNLGKQIEIFKMFINLAKEEMKAKKVIMHCFSGNMTLVKRIAQNGWYLSIPTSIKYSEQFQKAVEMVDIEQLLCETDSPFMQPDKEGENDPSTIAESYKKIAQIKSLSLKEVENKIEENYGKLFSL
ncbi:TatD family hydrolase [Candidatus Pacearchaeota archaeon]|nr:TatD family hydrolase [Candidatus Pacearchaeota archaeon]